MESMKIMQRMLSTSLADSCQNIFPSRFLTHHFQATSLILKARTVPHRASCKRVRIFPSKVHKWTQMTSWKIDPTPPQTSVSPLVSQWAFPTRILKPPYRIRSPCSPDTPLCLLPLHPVLAPAPLPPKKRGKIWLSPLHRPRQQHQLFALCSLLLAASMLITWSFHFLLQLLAAAPRGDKNPGPCAAAGGTELWSPRGFIN